MGSITIPGALLGSAVIGGVGAGVQANAAQGAAKTQATAAETAAQQQAASEQQAINAQLQMFGVQQQNLAPYNAAGQNALASLQYGLGVGSPTPSQPVTAAQVSQPGAAAVQQSTTPDWNAYVQNNPDILAAYQAGAGNGMSMAAFGQQQWQQYGQNEFTNGGRQYSPYGPKQTAQPAPAAQAAPPAQPQQDAYGSTMPAPVNGPFAPPPGQTQPGASAFGGLNPSALGPVPTFNWSPTQDQLAQTPGYQFTLNQGLNQLQNQKSAAGGALGGNQLKAIQQYAQGLAGTTYQQNFSNAQTQYQDQLGSYDTGLQNQQQQYNMLANLVNTGQGAAAGVGAGALSTGQGIGNNLASIGAALAGGTTGAANANSAGTIAGANAFSNVGSSLGQNFLTAALLQNGGLGTSGGGYAMPEFY